MRECTIHREENEQVAGESKAGGKGKKGEEKGRKEGKEGSNIEGCSER